MFAPLSKRFRRIVVAGLAGAMWTTGCSKARESGNLPKLPPLVISATVHQTVAPPIVRRGLVTPRASFRLGFGVPGTVSNVCCRAGDTVRRGQVIATLRRAESDARIMAASAGQARAIREYKTTARLVEDGALAPAQAQSAKELLDMATADRLLAKEFADRTRLLSPIDGIVASRHAEPGEVVGAGAPIVVVADSGAQRVQVGLTQRELPWVAEGGVVEMSHENGEYVAARIGAIAPTPSIEDGLFAVEVVPEKTGSIELEPGAMTRLRFTHPGLARGLLVPIDAVVKRRGDYGILVLVEEGNRKRARWRRVVSGTTYGTNCWITEGLRDGETIVTEGAYFIDDGQEVRVTSAVAQNVK